MTTISKLHTQKTKLIQEAQKNDYQFTKKELDLLDTVDRWEKEKDVDTKILFEFTMMLYTFDNDILKGGKNND